jgi:hypothetical protein
VLRNGKLVLVLDRYVRLRRRTPPAASSRDSSQRMRRSGETRTVATAELDEVGAVRAPTGRDRPGEPLSCGVAELD